MGFLSKSVPAHSKNIVFECAGVEETAEIAKNFAKNISLEDDHQGAVMVGLYGELGSGKTTFMKYLAQALGVKEEIKSPTFVIMKRFSLKGANEKVQVQGLSNFKLSNFQTLIHIDAYRIEKPDEMLNLGWQEIIADSKNLICVEWPERIAEIMPKHIIIKFEHEGETERKITIQNE